MIVGPPLEKPPTPEPAPTEPTQRTLFRGASRFRPPDDGHDHRLPLSLQALVIVSFLGLLAAGIILFVYIVQTNERVGRLEEYVAGRGEYRDQEAARLKEEVRSNWCEVLDTLPAGEALDRVRVKFDCGPGMPRTTNMRAQLRDLVDPEPRYTVPLDREPHQTRGGDRADAGSP